MALLSRRLVRRAAVVCPLVAMLACGDGKTLCFCGDDDGTEVPRDGGPQFAPAFDAGARPPARDVEVADPEDAALGDASASKDAASE